MVESRETSSASKIEILDDEILDEEFKKSVVVPYFRDIYKDLVVQSDDKKKGISKYTLLNVSNQLPN